MIVIDNWKGLVTNASPYAIPPGAAVTQVNFQCVRPGELTSRFGQTTVGFATHNRGAGIPVVLARHQLGSQECVVYQTAGGGLVVARGVQ
jgi:hypothetical protein